MNFTLPKLSYSYDALEPYIDKQTMKIHHLKHHQSYTDKLNDALAKHPDLPDQEADDLIANVSALPADIQTTVHNQGGGYVNHNLFWKILSPKKTVLSDGPLKQEIVIKFKSYEQFVESFTAQATSHFGSGWAWLVVDADDQLQILTTSNQNSPLMQGHTPILALDLWEHAYYLKYQNRRPEYITAFWSVVNWPAVNEKYQQALQH